VLLPASCQRSSGVAACSCAGVGAGGGVCSKGLRAAAGDAADASGVRGGPALLLRLSGVGVSAGAAEQTATCMFCVFLEDGWSSGGSSVCMRMVVVVMMRVKSRASKPVSPMIRHAHQHKVARAQLALMHRVGRQLQRGSAAAAHVCGRCSGRLEQRRDRYWLLHGLACCVASNAKPQKWVQISVINDGE